MLLFITIVIAFRDYIFMIMHAVLFVIKFTYINYLYVLSYISNNDMAFYSRNATAYFSYEQGIPHSRKRCDPFL